MSSITSLIAVLLPTGNSANKTIETHILVQSEEYDFADALLRVLKLPAEVMRSIAIGHAGQEVHPSKLLEIKIGDNTINGESMKEDYYNKIIDLQSAVENLLSKDADLHLTLSIANEALFTSFDS